MPVNARQAALKALTAYRKRGARPDMVLSAAASEADRRDMALAVHLVNGVLQNELYLDHYLVRFSGREKSYFEPVVLDILRLGLYQLWFLDRVPAHAAVHESVELAKKETRGAAGLVNAILRKVPEERPPLGDIRAENETERLSIAFSHPVWLVEEFCSRWGIETAGLILAADNEPRPVSLIVNEEKTSVERLAEELRGTGMEVERQKLFHNGLLVQGGGALERLDAFRDGACFVEDPAAYLAASAAAPKPGNRVCDVCAAPGGKSFASALMMKNMGRILACDIHPKKLRLVEKGAERLGFSVIETAVRDGREESPELREAFDVVICDVPCSGFGVMGKKPEIRYKEPADLDRLPDIQLAILTASADLVKPGGTLLYSTCTLRRAENEDVIRAFLNTRDAFAPDTLSMLPEPFCTTEGMTTILPHMAGTDGFFICRMKKKS